MTTEMVYISVVLRDELEPPERHSPSNEQPNNVLDNYQNKQLVKVETFEISITQEFFTHKFFNNLLTKFS